ncbi:MAG TPA: hypothetical protein GX736_03870 [Mogibacterium sp.]|nr:hypothetical protein [Mogibacterium sp.]
MKTVTERIEEIMNANPGEIYSINDFYYLATKNTVKSVLYRLEKEGKISRLIDGLYTKPKYSEILKECSYPSVDSLAEKIADKYDWNISATGDLALNYTGISTQIPNEYIYISDGPYRSYEYKNKTISFKHTSNRNITSYSGELSILIQAIKALGKDNISKSDLEKLADFSKNIEEDLVKDTLKLPFWIQEVLRKIEVIKNEKITQFTK